MNQQPGSASANPGKGSASAAVVVLGPTASGKSEVGCALARRFGGWILSVDSMAVYRGLDIGTSKPSAAQRFEIPHRGLDLTDPDRDFSLGDYLRAAERALEEMRAAGALPILVGGTGLYLRGLLKGVADFPPRNVELRRRLRERERREGPLALHRLLSEADPSAAERISPMDRQRLVRALELAEKGLVDRVGRVGPEWAGPDRFPTVKIGVTRDRRELADRITRRVDGFLSAGLVAETRRLLERVPPGANAFKALGYREVAAHLGGECDLETARGRIIRNTLAYAKRQMTWFRKEAHVRWFELKGPAETAVAAIGDHVAESLSRLAEGSA